MLALHQDIANTNLPGLRDRRRGCPSGAGATPVTTGPASTRRPELGRTHHHQLLLHRHDRRGDRQRPSRRRSRAQPLAAVREVGGQPRRRATAASPRRATATTCWRSATSTWAAPPRAADDIMAGDVELRRPDVDGRRPREAGGLGARDEHPDAVDRVPVGRPDRQRDQLRRADGRRDGRPSDPAQAVPRHLARAASGDPHGERGEQHRGRNTALRRRRRGDDRRQHGRPDPRRQPPRRPAGRLRHVRLLAGRGHGAARSRTSDFAPRSPGRPTRPRPTRPAGRAPTWT